MPWGRKLADEGLLTKGENFSIFAPSKFFKIWGRMVLTALRFLCKHVVCCEYGTLILILKILSGESNYAMAA